MKFIRDSKNIYYLKLNDIVTLGEISRDRKGWTFHFWPQWGHPVVTEELKIQAKAMISDQRAILNVTERLLK